VEDQEVFKEDQEALEEVQDALEEEQEFLGGDKRSKGGPMGSRNRTGGTGWFVITFLYFVVFDTPSDESKGGGVRGRGPKRRPTRTWWNRRARMGREGSGKLPPMGRSGVQAARPV